MGSVKVSLPLVHDDDYDDDDCSHRSSGSPTAAGRHDRASAAQNETVDAGVVQPVSLATLNVIGAVLDSFALARAAPAAATQPRENISVTSSFGPEASDGSGDPYECEFQMTVSSEAEFDQALEAAASVTSLKINTHFLTIDNSPRVALFSGLHKLKLLLGTAPDLAAAEKRLLEAVSSTPVEELSLSFHAGVPGGARDEPHYDPRSVPDLLAAASKTALLCSTLKELVVDCLQLREPGEGFRLDNLFSHESLEMLVLCNVSLTNDYREFLRDNNDAGKLRRMCLWDCRVGEDGLRLISCFTGLEKIQVIGAALDHFPTTPPTGMSIFAERTKVDWRVSPTETDRQVHLLSSNFKRTPSSLTVTVDDITPSLKDLLVNRSGALGLKCCLETGSDSRSLCEGIEEAQSLTSLELCMMGGSNETITPVLDSLKVNSSLLDFVGEFRYRGTPDSLVVGPHVEALVSCNASLKVLAIQFRAGIFAPAVFTGNVVAFVARGLRRNRSLEVVDFSPRWGEDRTPPWFFDKKPLRVSGPDSAEIVSMLEECNTTLQQIDGLEYENREHEERIEYLLSLNRRGPSFVANASAGRVRLSEWGDFLARISTDDCNQFVVNLARQALFGGQGGEARGTPREHA